MAGITHEGFEHDLRVPVTSQPAVFGELRVGRTYSQSLRTRRWKLHRQYKFEATNGRIMTGRSTGRLVAECPHSVSVGLHDVFEDPAERINLAGQARFADVCDRLLAELDGWWQGLPGSEEDEVGGDVEIDDVVVPRLQDLGYID